MLPFYLSSATRPSPTLSRDSPSVIRARIRAITFSCIASSLITIYILAQLDHDGPADILRQLGWWPLHLISLAKTLLLCSILFAGPLFEAAIIKGRLTHWIRGTYFRETFASWTGWRNYVAGPVSEELVFRSLVIPLHILAHISPSRMVFVTPLYFGIAHIHHFYEFVLTHPELPLLPAVIRTIVQFSYTSVFGFLAAFIFLRTGSLYAVIAAHVFCNWMGLPRFWGRVRVEAGEPIGPPRTKKEDEEPPRNAEPSKTQKKADSSTLWTASYYILLVAGAYGFWKCLWPLTESGEEALAYFNA